MIQTVYLRLKKQERIKTKFRFKKFDIVQIASILGHSDINTTDIYLKDDVDTILKQLEGKYVKKEDEKTIRSLISLNNISRKIKKERKE